MEPATWVQIPPGLPNFMLSSPPILLNNLLSCLLLKMPRYTVPEKRLKPLIKRIKSYPGGEEILEYVMSRNIKISTLRNYLYMLIYYHQLVGSYEFNKKNIITFLSRLKTLDVGEWTKARAQKNLKALLNSMGLEDLAKLIQYKKPRNQLQRSDLLSHEDVYAMINATNNTMYKALIMTAYETGARPSELLEMRIKDVDIRGNYGYISIPMTKTSSRTFPIFLSIPYLTNWLNSHPNKRPLAYLWYDNNGKPLHYNAYRKYIRELMDLAGVKTSYRKPYIFRHTRITEMCMYLPSRIVKKLFGIKNEKTLDFYEHLAMQDVEDTLLSFYGEKPRRREPFIKCRSCGARNLPVQEYCAACGVPLSKEAEIITYQKLMENQSLYAKLEEMSKKLETVSEFLKRYHGIEI